MRPVSRPSNLPSDRQGRHGSSFPPYLPIRRKCRQSVREPRRVRRRRIFGPFIASGLSNVSGGQGRLNLQDDGRDRHKSVDTLRGYVRDTELFKDHAGAGLL